MDDLKIIDEHIIIREIVGYDFIKDIEVWDLPSVLKFLKIIWNYDKMLNKINEL